MNGNELHPGEDPILEQGPPHPARLGYPHASLPEQVSKYDIISYPLSSQELLSQAQTNCFLFGWCPRISASRRMRCLLTL